MRIDILIMVGLVGVATASLAGIRDISENVNLVAREGDDKETVTVTVTSIPESCSAAAPGTSPVVPASMSTPITVAHGASGTATTAVPAGYTAVTPGAPATSSAMSPMQQPTGTSVVPVPVNSTNLISTMAQPSPVVPPGSASTPAPTTMASASSMGAMSESSMGGMSKSEESSTATASTAAESSTAAPSSSSSPTVMASSDGEKTFPGVSVLLALAGSVALLI